MGLNPSHVNKFYQLIYPFTTIIYNYKKNRLQS
nr:MAG TPA: hypothetical protein [Caudoviricetes sp.]